MARSHANTATATALGAGGQDELTDIVYDGLMSLFHTRGHVLHTAAVTTVPLKVGEEEVWGPLSSSSSHTADGVEGEGGGSHHERADLCFT